MSTEENKAKQRRLFEEVINKGNLAIIPEFIASDYYFRSPLGMELKGPEGFRQAMAMMRTALPDLNCRIEDIFAEGDRVAARFTMTGTFKGEMMGIAPTGKKATVTGVLITRWSGGKEVEAWEGLDAISFYQQLGIPIPQQ